jgi:hypothetical protein
MLVVTDDGFRACSGVPCNLQVLSFKRERKEIHPVKPPPVIKPDPSAFSFYYKRCIVVLPTAIGKMVCYYAPLSGYR